MPRSRPRSKTVKSKNKKQKNNTTKSSTSTDDKPDFNRKPSFSRTRRNSRWEQVRVSLETGSLLTDEQEALNRSRSLRSRSVSMSPHLSRQNSTTSSRRLRSSSVSAKQWPLPIRIESGVKQNRRSSLIAFASTAKSGLLSLIKENDLQSMSRSSSDASLKKSRDLVRKPSLKRRMSQSFMQIMGQQHQLPSPSPEQPLSCALNDEGPKQVQRESTLKQARTLSATRQNSLTTSVRILSVEEARLRDHIFANYEWYIQLRHMLFHEWFQRGILALIVISSINLAFDSPLLDPNSIEKKFIDIIDTTLVYIFTIEMVVKIFVMGLVGMPGAYLNDNWNKLDAIIVITSLIPKLTFSSDNDTHFLSALRVLRAFIPLRIAVRHEELRIVLVALTKSLPMMMDVCTSLSIIWLMFGILSVQLFAGKFYSCSLDDISEGVGETDREKCINLGGDWVNADYHFDDIFHAIQSLFVVATLSGWNQLMYDAVDATDINMLPVRDNNQYTAVFFILFILIGSFFLVSLLVSMTFESFVVFRDDVTGIALLNDDQKAWVNLQNKIVNTKPMALLLPPSVRRLRNKLKAKNRLKNKLMIDFDLSQRREEDNNFVGWCYFIAISTTFEKFIMICICLNILCMCFTYEDEPAEYTNLLENINTSFTFIFLIEAILKLFGFGVKQYFADHWNKFDFAIVMSALFEFITQFLPLPNTSANLTLLRVLRVCRVSRLVRIIKSAEKLKTLFKTAIESLSSSLSVASLLFLLYFVSAILSMNLFANVKGECINEHANFGTFLLALLTMFRISTGEDWACIMTDACDPDKGGFEYCWIFFISFGVIVSWVMLNLFIATMLQAFEPKQNKASNKIHITDDDINEFIDAWSCFDPIATGYMNACQFLFFLRKIKKPMGIGLYGTRTEMYRLLRNCDIVVHEDNSKLNFCEVLFVLAERIDGVDLPPDAHVTQKINKQLLKKFNFLGENKPSLGVLLAVLQAQKIWKKKLEGKRKRDRERLRVKSVTNLEEQDIFLTREKMEKT